MGKNAIIILHGWGLSAKRFEPLTKAFQKKGFLVYTPDLPGFGTSSMPEKPLYLSDYTDYLRNYIKKNHIKNPILFGHSFGGRAAIKYASMYPRETFALILSGTPGYSSVQGHKLQLFIRIAKIGGRAMDLPLLKSMKETVRKWYYYVVGARDFYRAQGVMRETFKHIVEEKLEQAMKHLQCNTLLLWGEEDTIVPVAIAERMQKVIKDARLIKISGATHTLPITSPDRCVSESMKFIATL